MSLGRSATSSAHRSERVYAEKPDRAVIDIGSNTVRLVIYSGPQRAPEVWLNEKVNARLGRDVMRTGLLPDKAIDAALKALARYQLLLSDTGIERVECVATAAVRDAENGPEFLEQVRALGLSPRLLSGEEEAQTSAHGVMGAFPGAVGTVADLGGGSLELVRIAQDQCSEASSMRLGTLLLPQLQEGGPAKFKAAVTKELHAEAWDTAHSGPLYMVGGTWRALAAFAMRTQGLPLTDPHGFTLSREEADALAAEVADTEPETLAAMPGIAKSRAEGLPRAASLLRVMLDVLEPDSVIFSSWGLREGLLLQQVDPLARAQDPLITSIAHFVLPRGGSLTLATQIAAWSAQVAACAAQQGEDTAESKQDRGQDRNNERLRLAAIMLCLAAARVEPNLRRRHAYNWAMDKRWVSVDPKGRAMLAATLVGANGDTKLTGELASICPQSALRQAVAWGLAVRLCRRLGAGSRLSLLSSALRKVDDTLVLRMEESRAPLICDSVRKDLKQLGQWLGMETAVQIVSQEATNRPDASKT